VNANERDEITASVAAHSELGPRYDSAVAEGPAAPTPSMPAAAPPPPAVPRRAGGLSGMVLGLGSMGLGVGATAVVVGHHVESVAALLMVLLIWAAIAAINIAHAQRRL
jgi:predicted lipid-binding transport protein (Tim44 family)